MPKITPIEEMTTKDKKKVKIVIKPYPIKKKGFIRLPSTLLQFITNFLYFDDIIHIGSTCKDLAFIRDIPLDLSTLKLKNAYLKCRASCMRIYLQSIRKLEIPEQIRSTLKRLYLRSSSKGNLRLKDLSHLAECSSLQYLDIDIITRNAIYSILEKCTTLTTLKLKDTYTVNNFSFLRVLSNLHTLHLSCIETLHNLEDIKLCSKLTNLGLYNCKSLRDISGLKYFPHLKMLEVVSCPCNLHPVSHCSLLEQVTFDSSDRLEYLDKCTSLQVIKIQEAHLLITLPELKEVHTLEIENAKGLINLQGIDSLPNLKFFSCKKCGSLSDISDLKECSSLDTLILSGGVNLTSLRGIPMVRTLELIRLGNKNLRSNLEALRGNIRLEKLTICYSWNTDLSVLDGCSALKEVILNDVEYITKVATFTSRPLFTLVDSSFEKSLDLTLFNTQVDLETVRVSMCSNYLGIIFITLEKLSKLKRLEIEHGMSKELCAIIYLPNLEYLHLNDNDVEDISNLKYFPQLKELKISSARIKSLEAVNTLTKLEKLTLTKCPNIHTLEPMKDCIHLTNIDINMKGSSLYFDLSSLLHFPKLVSARIKKKNLVAYEKKQINLFVQQNPNWDVRLWGLCLGPVIRKYTY